MNRWRNSMTHVFNDDMYEICGNYHIIGRADIEYNKCVDKDWTNWDFLILYNLNNKDIEVQYCRKKLLEG